MVAVSRPRERSLGSPPAKDPPSVVRTGGRLAPTRRLAALAFAGLAILLVAGVIPEARVMVLALDAALLLAAVRDLFVARQARLEVVRLPHGKLNLGARNIIQLRVRNLDAASIRLRIRDDAPPEFAVEGLEGELALEGFREARHDYRVTPPRRGRFVFGDVHLRVQGPLGLCSAERHLPAREDAHVYPDLRGAARLMLATTARDLSALGLRQIRRDGQGSEFARLRDYVQGDPPPKAIAST